MSRWPSWCPALDHLGVVDDWGPCIEIQRALLPPPVYRGPFVEAAATTRPCGALGGDFFDYLDTGREFRVVLGDVCGKGAPAALQAAVVQGILAREAETDESPASALAHLNRALCRRPIPGRFVTIFYGILTPDHRLVYSNAGQCLPLLVNQHHVRRLDTGGCPLGLFRNTPFMEESVQVETGDTLVVFSDGIVDASQAEAPDASFGDTRILELVRDRPDQGATAILERMLAAVRAFTGEVPPGDDMTALVVRYMA
jgi:sigma-B regulation protein RsbU (phosphoserine phosphatase)